LNKKGKSRGTTAGRGTGLVQKKWSVTEKAASPLSKEEKEIWEQ